MKSGLREDVEGPAGWLLRGWGVLQKVAKGAKGWALDLASRPPFEREGDEREGRKRGAPCYGSRTDVAWSQLIGWKT